MSVLLETPSDMRRIAAHIRSSADNVRDHARRLTLAAEATRWRSAAATEFRDQTSGLARQMLSVADRLDHAAHALERHAQHVHDLVTAPVHAARSAVHALGNVVPW